MGEVDDAVDNVLERRVLGGSIDVGDTVDSTVGEVDDAVDDVLEKRSVSLPKYFHPC